eukprot:CAMPEP_0167761252 /NCGR_PEP_ID=MMETSP0110_2-20121227/12064_1 /TAXON_ID=629695 /ORGANISM="Gymnochlora sp., Strain CCMP2014" /LENGTH=182 /DNA_ID=CAMNT_0007647905 /DNA_START=33 /DNA_END=581 /DNA_ORIENTATION=+
MENFYDFYANRHLLKLYKFEKKHAKSSIAAKILVKAMMQLPSSDFTSSLYLVPKAFHSDEPVRTIIELANLLESFELKKFWKLAEEQKEFKDLLGIPGFCESVEKFVVTIFSSTYCDVSVSTLESVLRNGAADLERLEKKHGWTRKDGIVTLSKREAPTTVRVAESQKITLQQVSKVLPLLS